MSLFVVTEKASGSEVTRYVAIAATESVGYSFADFDHAETQDVPDEAPATRYGGRRRLTKQEFLDLLGDTAVTFILSAAKTDIEVEKWIKRLDLTTPDPDGTSIDLDDPRTVAGVTSIGAAMVSLGAVASDWAQGVLNG